MEGALTHLAKLPAARPEAPKLEAPAVAEELLAEQGVRLVHSRGVAGRAKGAARILPPAWCSAIADAAWLHDIGYADGVAQTSLHQLDGARWLAAHGWPPEVCRLVGWHSGAEVEARMRGLEADLEAEFEAPPALARSVLAWADLTTSPIGESWTVERRLAEILERHAADSVVHQAMLAARPGLLEAARTVQALLEDEDPSA